MVMKKIIIKNALKILKIDPYIRCRMIYNSRTVKELNHNIKHLVQLGFKEIFPVPDFLMQIGMRIVCRKYIFN